MTTFTIGADPEIFVKKNGKPFSAYGLIPGTKKKPYKTERGAVQVDGMALEFNIEPTFLLPHYFDDFNQNIVQTLKDLRNLTDKSVNFNIAPVQEFSPEYMASQPDEAKELGCDPDYNAYTLTENPRPDGERNFRTAAGHIHIGWGADIPVENEEHIQICAGFIKMMDATVGMFMTYIDRDPRRRELYGKAGAFRPKSYGVEYRTPSNLWIIQRERRQMIHALSSMATQNMKNGRDIPSVTGLAEGEEAVRRVIDNGDHAIARNVLTRMCTQGYLWSKARLWAKIQKDTEKRYAVNSPN